MLGEQNREVLCDILGYDEARYAALVESGVIGTRPTAARPVLRMSMEERVRQGRLATGYLGLQGAAGHPGLTPGAESDHFPAVPTAPTIRSIAPDAAVAWFYVAGDRAT